MTEHKRAAFTIACLVILLAGFALRLTRLDRSLSYDELDTANSILADRLDPTKVEAPSFVLFLFTAPLGALVPNEWGMRWTSVMAGMLVIALSYRVASRIGDRRAGLIAVFLIAVVQIFIHYSQIARFYSLTACLSLVSLTLLVEPQSRQRAWAYPLALSALSGLHMLAGLWVAVQLAVVAAHRLVTRRGVRWSMIVAAVIGVAAIIALIQLIALNGHYSVAQKLAWIPLRTPLVYFVLFTGSTLGLMRDLDEISLPWRVINLIIIGVSLFSAAGLWRRWTARTDKDDWLIPLLILLAALPNLALVAVSYIAQPIYLVRYMMPSVVAVVLLVALGLSAVRPPWIAGLTLIVLATLSLRGYYSTQDHQRVGWRTAVTTLRDKWLAGDGLLTCTDAAIEALRYYGAELPYHPIEASEPLDHDRIWVIGESDNCPKARVREQVVWLQSREITVELRAANVSIYLFESGQANH